MRINFYVFFVGLRYFFIKRKEHFGAFISLISILGIAVGVMVLITVLSVMNGFSKEIRAKILSNSPHITLKSFTGILSNWKNLVSNLKQYPSILGVAPFIYQHGLLAFNGYNKPVSIIGIDPAEINEVYAFTDNMINGKFSNLSVNSFNLFISKNLADNLGLQINDTVNLIVMALNTNANSNANASSSANANTNIKANKAKNVNVNFGGTSNINITPQVQPMIIGGIFKTGITYADNHIFMHIKDMSKLYKMGNGISGIQLKIQDELKASKLANEISIKFNHRYHLSDWTLEFKAFFDALHMEKTVMGCILLLIIAVAGFNLVSSLIMLVMDKRTDIAILRVMGATREEIMLIFILQGSLIGILGTLMGVLGGLLLANNITSIVNWLEQLLKIQFVTEEAYFIGFLPSDIHSNDVILVTLGALIISIIATIYPAWRASNIKPAEALRYE